MSIQAWQEIGRYVRRNLHPMQSTDTLRFMSSGGWLVMPMSRELYSANKAVDRNYRIANRMQADVITRLAERLAIASPTVSMGPLEDPPGREWIATFYDDSGRDLGTLFLWGRDGELYLHVMRHPMSFPWQWRWRYAGLKLDTFLRWLNIDLWRQGPGRLHKVYWDDMRSVNTIVRPAGYEERTAWSVRAFPRQVLAQWADVTDPSREQRYAPRLYGIPWTLGGAQASAFFGFGPIQPGAWPSHFDFKNYNVTYTQTYEQYPSQTPDAIGLLIRDAAVDEEGPLLADITHLFQPPFFSVGTGAYTVDPDDAGELPERAWPPSRTARRIGIAGAVASVVIAIAVVGGAVVYRVVR